MLKYRADLISARNICPTINLSNSFIKNDNNTFLTSLISSNGILPHTAPFEIHPYKNELPLNLFEKYIIGTFPPISYTLDNKIIVNSNIDHLLQPNNSGRAIQKPRIPFYHGNLGSMWDFILTNDEIKELNVLLNKVNGRNLAKEYLISFLRKCKINYADIIDSTQRSLNKNSRYDSDDKNLYNIYINKALIKHILSNENAKFLLFNTSSIFGNVGIELDDNKKINVTKNTKSFDIFFRACQDLDLQIQIKVTSGNDKNTFEWVNISELNTSQRKSKILFEVKISNHSDKNNLNLELPNFNEKILTIITPFSPAAVNRGKTKLNAIVDNWICLNSGKNTNDFLKFAYHSFRNNDIDPLYLLNR